MCAAVPPPGQLQFPSVAPDSVTASWSPPEGAPGSYKYKVTWRRGQEQHVFTVGRLKVEVAELLPGEKYHFSVTTVTEDGHHSTCVERSVQTGETAEQHTTSFW